MGDLQKLYRARLVTEGGGLADWQEYRPLDDAEDIFEVATDALAGHIEDHRAAGAGADSLPTPDAIVLIVEAVPVRPE
jgi:hypothetical protein